MTAAFRGAEGGQRKRELPPVEATRFEGVATGGAHDGWGGLRDSGEGRNRAWRWGEGGRTRSPMREESTPSPTASMTPAASCLISVQDLGGQKGSGGLKIQGPGFGVYALWVEVYPSVMGLTPRSRVPSAKCSSV